MKLTDIAQLGIQWQSLDILLKSAFWTWAPNHLQPFLRNWGQLPVVKAVIVTWILIAN